MAERYTRLFVLPTSFYAENAPVLIRAGALLRDAYSQDLLVQLKFYNLDPEEVTGLKVRIQMLDALGPRSGKRSCAAIRIFTLPRMRNSDRTPR